MIATLFVACFFTKALMVSAQCTLGTYNRGGACPYCPVGSYGITAGLTNEAGCIRCVGATYGATMLSTSPSVCKACATGTEPSEIAGAVGCLAKPAYAISVSSLRESSAQATSSTHSNSPGNVLYGTAGTWKSASYTYFGQNIQGSGAYVLDTTQKIYSDPNRARTMYVTTPLDGIRESGFIGGEWIQLSFPSPISIGSFQIKSSALSGSGAPVEFMVLGSDDGGLQWSLIEFVYDQYWRAAETKTFIVGERIWRSFTHFRMVISIIGMASDGEVELDEWSIFPYVIESCNAGSFMNQVSSVCTQCSPGTYSDAVADSCIRCAAGTYSNIAGRTSTCILCPAGTHSSAEGATQNEICSPCSPGTYSTASGAYFTCTPCSAGKYSAFNGASLPSSCTPCITGKYATSAGAINSAICKSCPIDQCLLLGHYSTCGNDTMGNCSQCQPFSTSTSYYTYSPFTGYNPVCPTTHSSPGYYRNCTNPRAPMWLEQPPYRYGSDCYFQGTVNGQPYYRCSVMYIWWQGTQWVGSSNFTDLGTFTATGGSEEPINILFASLEAGYTFAWELKCNPGTYTPFNDSIACMQSTPGHFSPGYGSSTQTPCASGLYSFTGASVCSATCPVSTSKSTNGSQQCVLTAPGFYSTAINTYPCPQGTYSSGSGASVCSGCVAGTYHLSCLCLPGFELLDGQCQQCKAGYFRANTTSPCARWNTTSCAPGYYLSNGTRFTDSLCLPCPASPVNASVKGVGCQWVCRPGFNNTFIH